MGGEVKRFSFGSFLAGAVLAFLAGLVGNIVASMIAGSLFGRMNAHNPTLGVLIGVVPGILLIIASRRAAQNGFGQGLLASGILMMLGGGLCGGGVAGLFG
jgi:hypothetical protein